MKQPNLVRSVVLAGAVVVVACGVEPAVMNPSPDALRDRGRDDEAHLSAIAVVVGSSPEGAAPLLVYLDGTLSRSSDPSRWVVHYSWDFGDGTPPVERGWAPHTYANPGTYTATLTVTDNGGQTASTSLTVRATPSRQGPKPVIDFYSKWSRNAPLTVYVDGTRSQGQDRGTWATSYQWDFGDASAPSNSGWSEHTYSQPGTYQATLTVTDSAGEVRSESMEVRVCPSDSASCAPAEQWERELCSNGRCSPGSVESDGQGNWLVTMHSSDPFVDVGGQQIGNGLFGPKSIISKFSHDGTHLWSIPIMLKEEGDYSVSVSEPLFTSGGSFWVIGHSSRPVDLPGEPISGDFVLKMSSSGQVEMAASVQGNRFIVDSEENIYTTDSHTLQSYKFSANILKLRWTLEPPLFAFSLDVDSNDNLLMTGLDKEGRYALAKMAPDGKLLWTKVVNTGQPDYWSRYGVSQGKSGELMVFGRFASGSTLQWAGSSITVSPADENWVLLGDEGGNETRVIPFRTVPQPLFGTGNTIVSSTRYEYLTAVPAFEVRTRSGILMESLELSQRLAPFFPWDIAIGSPGKAAVLGGEQVVPNLGTPLSLRGISY